MGPGQYWMRFKLRPVYEREPVLRAHAEDHAQLPQRLALLALGLIPGELHELVLG